MQSYQLHLVSEHLNDRYPYLELPFSERYDKTQVYHAVFDRSIPKLIEILLMKELEHFKYRDAIITLNEMCSHQENKDQMISQGLIEISSAFLHHKVVEIRREAVLLLGKNYFRFNSQLGSLCTIQSGRDHLIENSYSSIKKLLFDESLDCRIATVWTLCRIVSGRDGVDKLVESSIVRYMIQSFLQYTDKPQIQEAQFVIMLLEAFVNVLQYEDGIQFFVATGIIGRLNKILRNEDDNFFDREWSLRLNYLCLDCLAKISVNHAGKQEAIDIKIIDTSSNFLDSIEHEIKYSVILIMNCSIHLDGKKQCVFIEDDKIITRLLELLESSDENLKKDVKQALANISELEEGFLAITKKLVKFSNDLNSNIDKLNEVFGPRVIVALSKLLPKTSELQKPPILPFDEIDDYKIFCQAICSFITQTPEAVTIASEEINKICEKLCPFVVYKNDTILQDMVFQSIIKICNEDGQALYFLVKYLNEIGDVVHEQMHTTMNKEIQGARGKKLYELIRHQQETADFE